MLHLSSYRDLYWRIKSYGRVLCWSFQDQDIFYGDLVSYKDEKLVDIKITSEIKEQKDILDGDYSCCVLVLVDFKTTLKFKLLEDSMHKDLNAYVEANYV